MVIEKEGRKDMDRRRASMECEACGCVFTAQPWEYTRIWEGGRVVSRARCPWCCNVVTRGENDGTD